MSSSPCPLGTPPPVRKLPVFDQCSMCSITTCSKDIESCELETCASPNTFSKILHPCVSAELRTTEFEEDELLVGLDIGSTSCKAAVMDPMSLHSPHALHTDYRRHGTKQAETALEILRDIHAKYPNHRLRVAVCGSGGSEVASVLGAPFVQEVVANAIAVRNFFPQVRTSIEIGGQDAKLIFFSVDTRGKTFVSQMMMNNVCSAGTGSFIDQIASLLSVAPDEFPALAAQGENVVGISARCGVFAKSDLQPLLNRGAKKADMALSTLHAIAKQTIGGLAQGRPLRGPIIFEGGPLTFNPTLIRIFQEKLCLTDEEVIVPDHPEVIVAVGAACSLIVLFGPGSGTDKHYDGLNSLKKLEDYIANRAREASTAIGDHLFFTSPEEMIAWREHNQLATFEPYDVPNTTIRGYLGIDAGSTTSKFVLVSDKNEPGTGHCKILYKFYDNNHGDCLKTLHGGLLEMRNYFTTRNITVEILGLGSTGYGEQLVAKAFGADYHTVETVCHCEAAIHYRPDATFVLDIGGQDVKSFQLKDGVVTGIALNEACSAGCGSFVETFGRALDISPKEIADLAFTSKNPSKLGSRCTVFMSSSIVTEQANGKGVEDILAGICRSIIENVFTKVVRVANSGVLGSVVVVQGGTFKNDAVLRSLEQYLNVEAFRAPHPGEMGAIGAALLTRKALSESTDSFVSKFDMNALDDFSYNIIPGQTCQFCTNNCLRTVAEFSNGQQHVTGNRCERGLVLGSAKDPSVREQLKLVTARLGKVSDLMAVREKLMRKTPTLLHEPQAELPINIGIPVVLEFFESLPFWHAFFKTLGFTVTLSPKSSAKILDIGMPSVPSDTVCAPAKLVHGAIRSLVLSKKVDVSHIFFPVMTRIAKPSDDAQFARCVNMCAVVQGYPMVIGESDLCGKAYLKPTFHFDAPSRRFPQLQTFLRESFPDVRFDAGTIRRAIQAGDRGLLDFRTELRVQGSQALESVLAAHQSDPAQFGVVLIGRPYHVDEFINHGLGNHFRELGIPVFSADSLSGLEEIDLAATRATLVNPFHARMYAASILVAEHPALEAVQIVSFGCGHDAIISDEMDRLLGHIEKTPLVLKLDESDAQGPLSIRVKSFVETVRARRLRNAGGTPVLSPSLELPKPYGTPCTREHIRTRKVIIPYLSESFNVVIAAALKRSMGLEIIQLPPANAEAISLGKQRIHADACHPAIVNCAEILYAFESGFVKPEEVIVAVANNCEDCRAGQYVVMIRKALDDAGFSDVPILTTSDFDPKGIHPGFKVGLRFKLAMVFGLPALDLLDHMLYSTRPYELNPGDAYAAYREALDALGGAVTNGGPRDVRRILDGAVTAFNAIPVDITPKPKVFVIGEILINFHETANNNIVQYLEDSQMEVILPGFTNFFRRDIVFTQARAQRNQIEDPFFNSLMAGVSDFFWHMGVSAADAAGSQYVRYQRQPTAQELAVLVEDMVDPTFAVGEGWLIPAEIIHLAQHGITSFVILQPFGCLPNHITGRGLASVLRERLPAVQIVPLDFDADTSISNVENRLQMLVMTAREMHHPEEEPFFDDSI